MRVAVDEFGPVDTPFQYPDDEDTLSLSLRHGFLEMGVRRSSLSRVTLEAGHIQLCTRYSEKWFGSADLLLLTIGISRAALVAASDTANDVALRKAAALSDARVGALLAAVNAERLAGFPSGRLFLDSVEQALAAALVEGHSVRHPRPITHRGGLAPVRLRRVIELVQTRLEDDLSLEELAGSAQLSLTHFVRAFRHSTGHSPDQYVLRQRVERAKEILRNPKLRVLDVALACGFKTQQHFARVFRLVCGASPSEYRREFL